MGGKIRRLKMTNCNHTLPNGEPAMIDMTRNSEFMRNFTKPLAASVGKQRPELGNYLDITEQKARKLLQGAHIFVCKLCGHYEIKDKSDDAFGKERR